MSFSLNRFLHRAGALAAGSLLACAAALAQTTTAPPAPPAAATAASTTIPAARAEPRARPAEPATRARLAEQSTGLPWADQADFEDARRGFVATLPEGEIRTAEGRVVYSLRNHAFITRSEQAPDTVHPSLWRQARLNQIHGLFKVVDGMYQVRSLDLANMTIIEGRTGLILVDVMVAAESARAALELYYAHRPRKPVKAVIYTHSHVDHFGGVRGVVDEADVKAGQVAIVAPAGFMEHAVAENVIAGNAMSRRAQYQFGAFLPPGERGQVDSGLGIQVPRGSVTLIAPTDSVSQPIDKRVLDGVEIEFQLTPGTEAPAEMNLWFPALKVLNSAENVTHTLHNIYTLRGAEVRDSLGWSKYIEQLRERYAGKAEVMVAQHHWPTWGAARIDAMLGKQRDLYRYMHDQTVRLLNQGLKPREIAEQLRLPPSLAREWFARGYYGTLSHNTKAIYQRYLGWYDANPVNLEPLPQAESAKRSVRYMGGAAAVLERARADYAQGDYRWVAEVTMQVVWAQPEDAGLLRQARELCADALEQLGYQAESGVWRNAYLMGALELRAGMPGAAGTATASPDVIRALPLGLWFDFLAVRLNPERAAGQSLVVNWTFPDTKETATLTLSNATLNHSLGRLADKADVAVTLDRSTLDQINLQQRSFADAVKAGAIRIIGNPQ
ncbi:MAG: hypothetical protein RLZZ584_3144, partial [Pseudomonadota bacterium]